MRSLLLLLKIRLNHQLGISTTINEKDSTKKAIMLVRRVVMFALFALLFFIIYRCASVLAQYGFGKILPTLSYTLASIITVMITIFKINELITGNADTEFLFSMPFGSMTQVLVIFFQLYLENILITALIEIPFLMAHSTVLPIFGGMLPFWIVGFIFTPLPTSGIAALIGIVLMLILSTTPHSNFIQTVISEVILSGIVALIIYIAISLYNIYTGGLTADNEALADEMLRSIIGNYRFSKYYQLGISERNVAWTVMYVLSSVLWNFLFIFMLGITFQEVTIALKSPLAYKPYEWKEQKATRIEKSLLRRELSQYIRSRSYMKYSLFFLLLSVVICASVKIVGTDIFIQLIPSVECNSSLIRVAPFFLCIFVGLGNTTYCSLTMEGKRHWIMETIPFNEKYVFGAKRKADLIFSLPLTVISAILLVTALNPGILNTILIIAVPFLYAIIISYYGLFINSRFVDYSTENESTAMYGSISFFLGYFPMVAVPAILTIALL